MFCRGPIDRVLALPLILHAGRDESRPYKKHWMDCSLRITVINNPHQGANLGETVSRIFSI